MKIILKQNESFFKNIVNEIVAATTEDIALDIRNAGLIPRYTNSYPTRIWDLINKNIYNRFLNDDDVVVGYSQRGPWNLIAIFHKPSGILFTTMREERFYQIKKEKNMHHYVTHLSKQFNNDLPLNQQCLWENDINDDEVFKSVDRICKDLMISTDAVRNHALILFSAKNLILSSIRVVMINCNFEEFNSISLDKYITVNESIVVDQVSDTESSEVPDIPLKFKIKAKEKQGLNHKIDTKKDANAQKGNA